MGVDLTLLPTLSEESSVAHTQINLERRRELWDPICALPTRSFAGGLRCYLALNESGDRSYGTLLQDPYGEGIKYVRAGDLCKLKDHEGVQDNPLNRGAWAFLEHLPPDWRVGLYWH